MAFPRCDETELGQPADFRRKRASLDAEIVRELLAVEWNVEFGCAFLLCQGAQIGHQPILRGTVRQNLDPVDYSEKLTEILRENDIKSVTIVRMEVPCCGGLEMAAKKALQASGKFIPWQVVTLSLDGKIIDS